MSHYAMPVPADKMPQRGNKFTRWVGRCMLASRGWKIQGTFPNAPKLVLLGAPHTSNWDGYMAMAVMLALGLKVQVVVKASLLKWPVVGLFTWLGFIPIDREKASNIVNEMVQTFNERDELWLVMAPEGTRNNAEKIKSGFYRIACGAGVPILPVTCDYKNKVVVCGDLLHPSGDMESDLPVLMDQFTSYSQRCPERLSAPMKAWKAKKGE